MAQNNKQNARINRSEVMVGTDTEIFVSDPIQNKYISCVGRIGGMKGCPIPIGEDCGLEEDNVAVEFTVPAVPLEGGSAQMYKNIQYCLNSIKERMPETYELAIVPSAIFPKEELNTMQAQEFGCMPDFNAWNWGAVNPRPTARNKQLRSAGGHIHIGYNFPDSELNWKIVQALDLYISLPSVIIDNDTQRRELYGKAGAFREKPYGVEYRTPSNFWVKDQGLVEWVFMAIGDAIDFVNAEGNFAQDQVNVIKAINNSDVELAKELCLKYAVTIPEIVVV